MKLGVPARRVYDNVEGLNNMRQVYNLKRSLKNTPSTPHNDPWGTILQIYGEDARKEDGFIKGVCGSSGQMSVWIWHRSQTDLFESCVGNGNPASIDTTFGHCAYATFFTFRNVKLVKLQDVFENA